MTDSRRNAPTLDSTVQLARVPRTRGRELRITRDVFKGTAYVRLREWHNGEPQGRGVVLRRTELRAVADAIRNEWSAACSCEHLRP